MEHITFDLETYGNTFDAPIVQIAAVKFKIDGSVKEYDTFERNIKLTSLTRYNFTVDWSTVKWWMKQNDEAIKAVFCNEEAIDLRQALREFNDWLDKPSEYVYWSHATFDPPILKNNYIKVGLEFPIPYRAHRDIRTLTHIAGTQKTEVAGIAHNALDDCKNQASSSSLRSIEEWKKRT